MFDMKEMSNIHDLTLLVLETFKFAVKSESYTPKDIRKKLHHVLTQKEVNKFLVQK